MIVVHHLNNSRSQRILWLLEELGLPYEIKPYQRDSQTRLAPPELKKVHPLGKSPVITDGTRTIAESGAIIDYVIRRHGAGRLQPAPETSAYDEYQQWMHFAEGSAMTQFLMHLFLGGYIPGVDQSQPIVAGTKERTAALLKHLDGHLAEQSYFAGAEFTAADIMMLYSFGIVRGVLHTDMALYPHLNAYIAGIEDRPAYKKAMAIAAEPPA